MTQLELDNIKGFYYTYGTSPQADMEALFAAVVTHEGEIDSIYAAPSAPAEKGKRAKAAKAE